MINIEDIRRHLDLSDQLYSKEYYILAQVSKVKKLIQGEIYIENDSKSQRIGYIRKGIIRAYQLDKNGDERTLMLRCENQIVASIDTILLNKPSRFVYEAIENTILVEIDYQKAKTLIDESPYLSSIRNKVLTGLLLQSMDRLEDFILLSPEERYIRLIENRPYIADRVQDKYLSTMLGITPVSLSRIRKRINAKCRFPEKVNPALDIIKPDDSKSMDVSQQPVR